MQSWSSAPSREIVDLHGFARVEWRRSADPSVEPTEAGIRLYGEDAVVGWVHPKQLKKINSPPRLRRGNQTRDCLSHAFIPGQRAVGWTLPKRLS